jgi:hypothetical protein
MPTTTYVPELQYPQIIRRPLASQDTSSDSAFHTVAKWIHTCSHGHDRCSKPLAGRLPKRVLEISQSYVFLREYHDKRAKYACLSHCWGNTGAALQLTANTLDAMKIGLATSNLPRTSKEAAEACVKLGISYLWIDAMCKSCL